MLKEDFWGKITNSTFFNISCPIMPKCFKKKKKLCDRPWDIRLNNFGPNWAQILLLPEKRIFGGKLTNTTIVYLLCPIMLQCLKKNTCRSWVIRCCSFLPNWTQITHLPLQEIFSEKLTLIFVCFRHPITILQCSKKSLKWVTKYKVA